MKRLSAALALGLLAACSSPSDDAGAPEAATAPAATAPTPAGPPARSMLEPGAPTASATTASGSGTVEAIDVEAKTITIAHGPIDALKWPAMTMTFKAPKADLSAMKQGDQVNFELTSTGMDGTITKITRK